MSRNEEYEAYGRLGYSGRLGTREDAYWRSLNSQDGWYLISQLEKDTLGFVTTGVGFADYNDASTLTTPLILLANTWTQLPNDGQGAFSNTQFLPTGVSQLLDTSTGRIDVRELPLGRTIFIRNDFTVTPSTNNQLVRFRYTLGAGAGTYTLEKNLGRMDSGSGVPYRFSLNADLIYTGDNNTRDNPIGIEVNTSGDSSLVNSGTVVRAA